MSKKSPEVIRLEDGTFVVKICKENIYCCDEPYPLNREKVVRYTDRLDSMNVEYEVIEYDLL